MRARIIVVEAGLELVPRSLTKHPSVIKHAARRGKKPWETLLDISVHYAAMRRLRNWEKRGRPDIVHFILQTLLGSSLNRRNYLEIFVHTVNDTIIKVDASTRLPKNYNRFVGLMEQLFLLGRVPPKGDKVLLKLVNEPLEKLVGVVPRNSVYLMDEKGEQLGLKEICLEMGGRDIVVLVGGFQRGTFSEKVLSLAGRRISVFPESLEAHAALSRLLCGLDLWFEKGC